MRILIILGLVNLSWSCGSSSSTSDCKGTDSESAALFFRLNEQGSAENEEGSKDCVPSGVTTEQNNGTTPGEDNPSNESQNQDAQLTLLNDVNRYRSMLGLSQATIDPALSSGAQAHAEYLEKNPHIAWQGLEAHNEDPSLPGYSSEGAAAGKAAVIHYIDPIEAVDGWMATLYHRLPLIRPSKLAMGVGHARAPEDANIRDFLVLDVIRGLGGAEGDQLIVFPPNGATKVPLEFGPEVPDPVANRPAGYPLTVTKYGQGTITQVTAKLTTGGKDVPIVLSTPESPATFFDQQNTIMLFSESPMTPHTTYQADVSFRLNGKDQSVSWSFTTGSEKCCAWKE